MNEQILQSRPVASRADDMRIALLTAVALLVTHAIAFMLHEYSHAFVAWLLGWKANPLALHYGHLTVANVLLQQEIDENVDYAPVFAAGAGYAVAAIAFAGVAIGNGVLYCVCAWWLRRRDGSAGAGGTLFVFWLALMACGNLWSYAPIRTITSHGDMAVAAKGLGISSWAMFPFVTAISVWAGVHFFRVVLPRVVAQVGGMSPHLGAFIAAVACFVYFGFYGVPALVGNYGQISALMSILSLFVLFPVVLMMSLGRQGRVAELVVPRADMS